MSKPPPKSTKTDEDAPWRKGNDVKGVVPPGRRLSAEARPLPWNASGVRGIIPPGKLKPGEGAATRWILEGEKRQEKKRAAEKKIENERKKPAGKPTAPERGKKGEVPEPKNLKEFLDQMAEFARENLPKEPATISELLSFVGQSSRPFEIIVAFAVGSALIGNDQKLRGEHQWTLERGAKTFFNLAKRLDKSVRPPRGLVPETLDPLFYDLPEIATQMPYAYLSYAFLGHLELLRVDRARDRKLMQFARSLYGRFIRGRRYGDRPLESMFPWDEPEWAPIEDD